MGERRWRGSKLLAKKYTKPEMVGSLYVPDAWKEDNSRSLWEVHETTEGANAYLGMELGEEWILVTSPNSGVFLEHDAEGREIYLLAASSIVRVIPWSTGDVLPRLARKKILVRMEIQEETSGDLVILREGARSTQGEVVEVHEDVREVGVGERVCFTRFSGTKTTLGGEDFLVMDESSILAVIPDEMEMRDDA